MTEGPDAQAAEFEARRGRLVGLAYRMLGSFAEAEDVVQDAFLRFRAVDIDSVLDPSSYLSTTVARLCLDRLKAARTQREAYVGTWLPEPIVDETAVAPDRPLELADDLSFALLMTLERLSPPERTAFLLHDVFGVAFEQIAQVLERSEPACRKLAERARTQVHQARPRFQPNPEQETQLLHAFMLASATGDIAALTRLLAEDAVLYNDGGGKRLAALNPIYGRDRIARFLVSVPRKSNYHAPSRVELRPVNQMLGCLLHYPDGDLAAAAFEMRDGVITRMYVVNNPDKLRHVKR
jgi:RNA polymerase sigma-70 factor, ECF subfamily